MQERIAIFGNGKLTLALVQGLVLAGYLSEQIYIIFRPETQSKDEINFFKSMGCVVTDDASVASLTQYIFLMVTSGGSGEVLCRLRDVPFTDERRYEIITIVSGLSHKFVQLVTPHRQCCVIPATCNVNIAFGQKAGLLCADGVSVILPKLGRVIYERPHGIRKAILSVGSSPSIFCTLLILGFEENTRSLSVYQWLLGFLKDVEKYAFRSAEYHKSTYPDVLPCLDALAIAYHEVLGYKGKKARMYVRLGMESTINALLAQGEFITIDTILKLRKRPMTKGGSTEKGANKVTTLEQARSPHYMSKEVVSPMNERMLQFPNEAFQSCKVLHKKKKQQVA